jgi:energy-converting hydrogenase Eha subunit F
VCPTLPVGTNAWVRGDPVKGNKDIRAGTAIATFDKGGRYTGHAAIYESQTPKHLNVIDQWVTPPAKAIHKRKLIFGAHGNSNNGDNFFIIE